MSTHRNYIRYSAIIFIVIVAAGLIASISPRRTSGDFDVYYAAGSNYLARAPLYEAHSGIEEFKYLPLFALAFSPLSLLGKLPALYLWNILNIILLYLVFYLFYKLRLFSLSTAKDLLLLIFLAALCGRYLVSNIRIGQSNILLSFLLALVMYLDCRKDEVKAGFTLALCLVIKLLPLLFLVYFLLRRKFRLAGFTVLFLSVFLLLPALYSGWRLNLNYLQEWFVLLRSSPPHLFYSVKNYSLLAILAWFFIARRLGYAIFEYENITRPLTAKVYFAWIAGALSLAAMFFYDIFSRRERGLDSACLDYAGLFVCALFFNPLANLNAMVFLAVPYFFILRYLFYSESGKIGKIAVAALTAAGFILSLMHSKVFFPQGPLYYTMLKYRFPAWTILSVFLSLCLVKLSLGSGIKKVPQGA